MRKSVAAQPCRSAQPVLTAEGIETVFNLALSDYLATILLLSVVVLVLLQQALTWRYIQLRPELGEPPSIDLP